MKFKEEKVEGIVAECGDEYYEAQKAVRTALRAYGELMDKEFEERSKDVHDDCVVTRGLEIARSMIRRSLEERK